MPYSQKLRTPHRRYGYSLEQREHYRDRNGDSELKEEFADDPLHKDDGYEYSQDSY